MGADGEALKRAAQLIADEAKRISARFSKRIPDTIKVSRRGDDTAYISAGGPQGKVAPNAYMFETEGARHPLFGDKRHWYVQPYRPFLEEAAEVKGQAAADNWADGVIDNLCRRHGFK